MMDTNNNENNSYDKNALLVYTPIRENMSFRIKNKKVQSLFCLNSSPSTIQKKKTKKVAFVQKKQSAQTIQTPGAFLSLLLLLL